MFVSTNQISDLNGSKHSNGWSNVQSAVKSNNVQTFRRIEFKKAKSDFSSNSAAPVEHNGVKKVSSEAPKKPVVKDSSTGLFEAAKATNYVQWKQVARVGPGFFNDGNTCYLNSTLQCLMYTPALAQIMRSESALVLKNFRQVHDQPKAIIQYFQRLVEEVWTSPAGKSLSPRSMVSNIRRVGKQFKPFRQEDAHEYLRQLLDCMHEEVLKANGVKLSDGKIAETTAISRVFGGYLCNTLTCTKCSYASKTFNHFQDVSLDITSGINSISNALDQFTKPEFLSHGNEWKCEKCQIKVKAKKQMTFSQLPNVLVLHLKRFSYGANGKNMKPINFTPTLTVTCHKETGVKKSNYELHGVVVHHGHSTHSGHYIAFVKAPNGSWYEMNDSHVTVVSINKVLSCQAYILFYSRVVPVAAPPAAPVAPQAPTASVPNGVSKNKVIEDSADMGVVVKAAVKPPSSVIPVSEANKPKITISSSTPASSVPAVVKTSAAASKTNAPDVSLSDDSDDDSDSDSDFSEPSDLDQIAGFREAFTKRLNGEKTSNKRPISEIGITPRPQWFKGFKFQWNGKNRTNIRELAAQMKENRSSKKARHDNDCEDEGSPVEKASSNHKNGSAAAAAPHAPPSAPISAAVSSPSVVHAKIYPVTVPVVSSPLTNGHAVSAPVSKPTAATEQTGATAPFVKKNVVIFNNGVTTNGADTIKNLIALSNRSRDTSGEGTWDSVSKELAEESHGIAVQQRRNEQKARNEKRLDAWSQKLDEGRVKKMKTGPTAYEAAFAGGVQPSNQFQQLQDVRGNSREAYFEAGSAPFEKKRKADDHHDQPRHKESNGKFHNNNKNGHHQNGKKDGKFQQGGFKKHKQY